MMAILIHYTYTRMVPVLYSPTSTAPSNEAGRHLIVEQTHIRSHLAIFTELPNFLAGSSGLKAFVRTGAC